MSSKYNPLVSTPSSPIAVRVEARTTPLYDYEELCRELTGKWSQKDEIEILTSIARDAPIPGDRIRAVKALRELTMDVLRVTGRIADLVAHRTVVDGENPRDTITATVHLLQRAAADTSTLIEVPDVNREEHQTEELPEPAIDVEFTTPTGEHDRQSDDGGRPTDHGGSPKPQQSTPGTDDRLRDPGVPPGDPEPGG